MISGIPETQSAKLETPAIVTPEIQERVTVGPPGTWVREREVDESFRHSASYSMLLFDRQHHASHCEDYCRVLRRLETRQAMQELGQWRLDFDPATHHVVIHSLSVRRGDITIEYAQPARFRFLLREGGLESQIINGWITLVVLLEDVQVGDLIDASYTIRTTPRFLVEHSWELAVIPAQAALRAFHFSMRFASGRAMQWTSNDKTFAPEVCETDGEIEWSWKKENLQFTEQEPNVPSWHSSNTWVQVSDCASWAEVSSGIASAWGEDLNAPELLRAVEEINAFATALTDRVNRALTMVQDDIRYLSVNVDLGGQIPSPPRTVLQRCYGDCKDKSFLLVHLLRLLGVNAQPVLVNTFRRRSIEQLLPMPGAFNHVIVKFEIDGNIRWVDATLPLQGGGALDRLVDDFGVGLPVGVDAFNLEVIPRLPLKNERYELAEAFSLDTRTSHPSILNVNIRAGGWHAENLRRSFANMGQDEVARSRERFYQQLFPELQRVGALQWEDDREGNQFALAETFDVPDAVTRIGDGKTCVFQYNAHYIQSILGIAQHGKRQNPYVLPHPCNVEHRIEIETTTIPGEALLPRVNERGSAFYFLRENRKKANRSIVSYTLGTLASVVPPEKFEGHKKSVNKVWPATTFLFHYASGLPAPQRRQTPGRKEVPFFPDAPRQIPAVGKKTRESFELRSARRRSSRPRDSEQPEKRGSMRMVWIILILFVAITCCWMLAVFLGT